MVEEVVPNPLERQCTATSKPSGKRCQRAAMRGQRVCPMHGGKAPRAVHAAKVRIMEEEASRILERLEGTPIRGPPLPGRTS